MKIFFAPNSAVASQPCPSGHITADKRLRYASPKLPSATSFIHKTLSEMLCLRKTKRMGEKTLKLKFNGYGG